MAPRGKAHRGISLPLLEKPAERVGGFGSASESFEDNASVELHLGARGIERGGAVELAERACAVARSRERDA